MKIISGGQTGADIAGLIVAKEFGFETGGVMPKGFRTLDGNKPEYARLYGMTEHSSYAYPPRTELNVRNSDGTLRFAKFFSSAGEKCTLKFISKWNKPYFDINISCPPLVIETANWIMNRKIKILNIAGNSERTCPGIEEFVRLYLNEVFLYL